MSIYNLILFLLYLTQSNSFINKYVPEYLTNCDKDTVLKVSSLLKGYTVMIRHENDEYF